MAKQVMHIKYWVEELKGKDLVGDLHINEKIFNKLIFKLHL
jgi:hypothetical protein